MHTHQKLHSEVITLSPRRPLTPQTRHKHIRDHRRPPDTRVWKRQPGSILCLAWEQLSAASWDHKSSLSTGHASSCGGMLNAGRRPELGGMPRVAGKKNKKGKKREAPSAPSNLGSFFSIRLIFFCTVARMFVIGPRITSEPRVSKLTGPASDVWIKTSSHMDDGLVLNLWQLNRFQLARFSY